MIDFLLGVPGKLKTIVDRLTSARAANLDNLDATVSSRAPASTALSTATWTSTRAGYLDNLNTGGIPGTFKSVQRGVVTVNAGASSGTATINSVTTSKAVLHFHGWKWGHQDGAHNMAPNGGIELTSSTTVTAYVDNKSINAGVSYFYFEVVEYY